MYDLELLIHGNAALGDTGPGSDLFPETQMGPRVDFDVERDRYGHVDLDLLIETNSRIKLVQSLANQHRFLHWELEFADIFKAQRGFDLVLGNPPWIKIVWEENGLLSDFDPKFAIRKLSAKETDDRRELAFRESPAAETAYLSENVASQGTQAFLNARQNYPLLEGQKANLYKCFLRWRGVWDVAYKRSFIRKDHTKIPTLALFVKLFTGIFASTFSFRMNSSCSPKSAIVSSSV